MPFYNFQIESAHQAEEVKEAIRETCACVETDRGREVITANFTAF